MSSQVIPTERIQRLNDCEATGGRYVLYWMQQSQRAECNHALEFAVQRANQADTHLLVGFGLTDDYPDANLRHYHFMLQGLQGTQSALRRRKIPLVVQFGDPPDVALRLAKEAVEVVCDRGYLRHQRQWREKVAREARRPVWQVESDAIVPVEVTSDKAEFAARTIRPKLNGQVDEFLQPLATTPIEKDSLSLDANGLNLDDVEGVLSQLSIDRSVPPVAGLAGGTSQAKARLKTFLADSLSGYDDRAAILKANVSRLSPYLHFGQISPLALALEVKSSRGHALVQKEAFLEELLVRRELAINFVYYHKDYDNLSCLPDWADKTLAAHEKDQREHQYTATELENAQTHDPAWNAAMIEMRESGYLHNHLRMYWGKKILEWTGTPQHAHRVALQLNNRYFLDGRDANSYMNVAWLFGMHDRAHQERPIFGKVRYMSAAGLKRKFDVDTYVRNIGERYGLAIQGAEPAE